MNVSRKGAKAQGNEDKEAIVAMIENEVAQHVVAASYKIHTKIGPGLLEAAYEAMLVHELGRRGLEVAQQVPIPIVYEGKVLSI